MDVSSFCLLRREVLSASLTLDTSYLRLRALLFRSARLG